MDKTILQALKTFHNYSAGRLDVWSLAGNSREKVAARRQLMSQLLNVHIAKVPPNKCGVAALRNVLQLTLGAKGDTPIAREADMIKKARALLNGKAEATPVVTVTGKFDGAVSKQLAKKRDPEVTEKLIKLYEEQNELYRKELRGGR